MLRERRAILLIGSLVWAFASAKAQTITLPVGDSARVHAAPASRISVPLRVDLSAAAALDIASLQGTLAWNPARLTLDSLRVVPATGFTFTPNLMGASAGSALFNAFSGTPLAASGPLILAHFTTAASAGGSRITFTPAAAGSSAGTSIISALRTRPLDVCVAPVVLWGDVSNDGTVNIIDAQQVARASVNLPVTNPAALAARGDVTADGTISILDAQQIARYSVRLPVTTRVNVAFSAIPAVGSMSVTADSGFTVIAGTTRTLTATVRDSATADLTGCLTVSWSSGNPAVATVSGDGIVTAVAEGTATITATAGGAARTATVTVTPSSTMVLTATPDSATSNVLFSTQPVVQIRAPGGALATGDTRQVAVSLTTGTGTLTGTTTVAAVGGVARFTDLAITGAGTHTLRFTANGLPSLTSTGFPITPPVGIRLLVGQTPAMTVAEGTEFTVPLLVDMTGRGSSHLASIATTISWDPTRYSYVRTSEGSWGDASGNTALVVPNAQGASTGTLLINGYTPDATYASFTLHQVTLRALASGPVALNATVTAAGTATGTPIAVTSRNLGQAAIASGTAYLDLSPATTSLLSGQTEQAAATPRDAAGGTVADVVAWSSSNAAVATVTSSGLITAITAGTATITAIASGRTASTTVTVVTPVLSTLAAGTSHSCTRHATGADAGAVVCWGSHAAGQIGDSSALAAMPRIVPQRVAGSRSYTTISSRGDRSCALSALSVYCWGDGFGGVPQSVAGATGLTTVATGKTFACGLATTGAALCWGDNGYGQLGDGTSTNRVVAGAVSGSLTFSQIVAGANHACALTRSGIAYCWGRNSLGALGDGTTTSRLQPTAVSTTERFVWLAAGGDFTCGRTRTSGVIHCWGDNRNEQVKAGSALNQLVPVPLSFLQGARQIVAGDHHACALSSNGTSMCWGYNGNGQLGDGSTVALRTTPVSVTGGVVFEELSAGGWHSCGRMSSGRVLCWGSNSSAQLGDQSLVDRTTPVVVFGVGTNYAGASLTNRVFDGFNLTSHDFTGSLLTGARFVQTNLANATLANADLSNARLDGADLRGADLTGAVITGATFLNVQYNAGTRWPAGFQIDGGPVTSVTLPGAFSMLQTQVTGVAALLRNQWNILVVGRAVTWNSSNAAVLTVSADGTLTAASAGSSTLSATSEGITASSTVTVEPVGAVYQGRGWDNQQPAASALAYRSALDSLVRRFPTGGYCDVFSSSYDNLANGRCSSGATSQIAMKYTARFTVPADRTGRWWFRIVLDAGRGSAWLLDGVPQAFRAGDALADAPAFTASALLSAGPHLLEVVAFEDCCAAPGAAYVSRDSSVWVPIPSVPPGVGVPLVTSVSVSPLAATLAPGQTTQLAATARDATNAVLLDRVVTWTSSNASVANVTTTGLVTAVAAGVAVITATVDGVSGTSSIAVVLPPVASVALTPSSGNINIGRAMTLLATVKDSAGVELAGRTVTWSSSAPAVATVNGSGVVTGVALGSTTITATTEGKSATVIIQVTAASVASITITPSSASFNVGSTQQLTAVARDSAGAPLTGRAISWTSSNPVVATVSSTGLVTGVSPGVVTVMAQSEGVSANVSVSVLLPLSGFSLFGATRSNCALTATSYIACWGSHAVGELAVSDTNAFLTRPKITTSSSDGLITYASLGIGGNTRTPCALTANGKAYCWGYNAWGNVGDGSTTMRSFPNAVSGGLTFARISSGWTHTCALTRLGQAYCWGNNDYGQLGDGTANQRTTPTAVAGGFTWTRFSAGYSTTCGVTGSADLYCWGLQPVGNGTTTSQPLPVQVGAGITWGSVMVGFRNACGLTKTGQAYCWGQSRGNGQLGDGSNIDQLAPVAVAGGLTFTTLAKGYDHTCGLTQAGTVYCWGSNSYGQLGDGTVMPRATPTLVSGGATYFNLVAGEHHSCAATVQGVVNCWGKNSTGQLGDGTTSSRLVPTPWQP